MDNNRKTDSYDFDEVDADDTQASDQENMEVGEGIPTEIIDNFIDTLSV